MTKNQLIIIFRLLFRIETNELIPATMLNMVGIRWVAWHWKTDKGDDQSDNNKQQTEKNEKALIDFDHRTAFFR